MKNLLINPVIPDPEAFHYVRKQPLLLLKFRKFAKVCLVLLPEPSLFVSAEYKGEDDVVQDGH